ncbi:MAG TPA: F0F1 ATP synthase subunit A [Candidatus Saccharimonadales bacterium]|nr:F0F1 ATP synthase subunit A [Candidatus Saccharimonadales bacterium]
MINNFAALDIHISLASQTLFTVFGFNVTNSMVTGAISLAIFLAIFIYVSQMVARGRYNRFVGFMQWAFEGMLSQIDSVIPDKKLARKIAPLALTIFFYVLISYWMSIIPGLETIFYNGVPVLRSITADMNFTFALAIIALIIVQVYAIRQHGHIGNLRRYLRNPFKDPIGSFEGFLELIGEVSRYSALSLRLFGNAFAGEILLIIIGALTSYLSVAVLPLFMGFELFIGLIQAYVFFVLTIIFTALALDSHGGTQAHPELTHPDHSSADTAPTAVTARE